MKEVIQESVHKSNGICVTWVHVYFFRQETIEKWNHEGLFPNDFS